QRAELIAIPMVDVDGVYEGDQGKCRFPWDHGRDYGEMSRFQAVVALKALLSGAKRAVYALDLHTPAFRGAVEEVPYIVTSSEAHAAAQAATFVDVLGSTEHTETGGTKVLVFDEEWNRANGGQRRCISAWLRSLKTTRMALTIEYPNAMD